MEWERSMQNEKAAWLWAASALGCAAPNAGEVLREFSDVWDLVEASRREDLSAFFTRAQLAALHESQPEDYIARLDDCKRHKVDVITWADEDYPALLRTIASPPPVLYYRGDPSIANRCFTFAIVGTRRPSAYGVEATANIAKDMARAGVALVSGLATGLDSESHKAALREGAPTIACIAFGHDQCYPAQNRKLKEMIEKSGLVLSEYPPGMPALRNHFLERNRLIAGLSRGICVAEARNRSGTMNTVSAALAAGRDVFSVPGSIFSPLSEGTNRLLKEGAIPALSGADILEWYHIESKKEKPGAKKPDGTAVSEDARIMRAALSTAQPQRLEELCAKTKLPPHKAMAALTELELAGVSVQLAGRRFQLKP